MSGPREINRAFELTDDVAFFTVRVDQAYGDGGGDVTISIGSNKLEFGDKNSAELANMLRDLAAMCNAAADEVCP